MADKTPYGPVEYADPGYQADGRKRYPIDTADHCRAAWSYVNQSKNAAKYTPEQLARVKSAIKRAAKKFGIMINDDVDLTLVTNQDKGTRAWWSLRNGPDGAEVAIYDSIGRFGLTAGAFIEDLRNVSGDLTVRLNTPGGEVFDGIAIYNALKGRQGKVTCVVDGLAASIGSVIAMAGDEVVMTPNAQLMIHEGQGTASGDASDMQAMADLLDKTSENLASIYAERTGGSQRDWRARMKTETWYNAYEAVDAGLADRVGDRVTNQAQTPTDTAPRVDQPVDPTACARWDPEMIARALKEAANA